MTSAAINQGGGCSSSCLYAWWLAKIAAPAGHSLQLPTDMKDLVAGACSSVWHWTGSCLLASTSLVYPQGDPCLWDGWWMESMGGLLPCTTLYPRAWGAAVQNPGWCFGHPMLCPSAASPLGHPPAWRLLTVWPLFPAENFPSLCSLSLLFPTMMAQAAWDVVLNLNAASLRSTKIINPLQTELCKK